jgi:hypothetical protein
MLGFAWFYSSESRPFNKLGRIQIKFSRALYSHLFWVVSQTGCFFSDLKRVTRILIFTKELFKEIASADPAVAVWSIISSRIKGFLILKIGSGRRAAEFTDRS